MEFAKKQLEKYGWKEGQGLGKNNSGISTALKPKLKFDNSGLGHSITDDLINPWWQKVFDQAAKNIKVKKSGSEVCVETNGDDVDISTKKRKSKYKQQDLDAYGSFVKVSSLMPSGEKRVRNDSSSESEEEELNKNKTSSGILQMTDQELFKLCGGRTVHKGARHGLRMNAKLARIEEQERVLTDLISTPADETQNNVKKSKKRKKSKKEKSAAVDLEEYSSKKLKKQKERPEVEPEETEHIRKKKSKAKDLLEKNSSHKSKKRKNVT